MTTALTKTDHQPTGTRRLKLRKWVLKITLIIAIFTPLTFMIGALGTKFGLWSLNFGFGVIVRNIGPKLIMVCGVLGLLSVILAAAIKPRKGFVSAGLAIFIALSGGLYGKSVSNKAAKLPFIHDVTTNTQDVPVFTDAIMDQRAKVKGVNTADYIGKRDRRDDELVSVLQTQAFPDIRPLILSGSPETIFIKAETVVKSLGWDIVNLDADTGTIEATDTTFWFGFEDDVIIRLRPSEGGGTVVDMRSLSRIGGSDLGKNAQRVRAFLKKLKAA